MLALCFPGPYYAEIMLALCFMLSTPYYAENYAGIIDTSLHTTVYVQ